MRLAIFLVVLVARVAAADPAELAALQARARNLASNGYCDAVKQVAKQVAELDASYYDTVFKIDPVIASCASPVAPPPKAVHSIARHRFTFDAEFGEGFEGYQSDYQSAAGAFLDTNASDTSSAATALVTGVGVGAFVIPRLAIGVRGLAAFSRATDITYHPADIHPAATYDTTFHTKLSQEIIVVNAQGWYGDNLWCAIGFGYGRHDFGGVADPGHAAEGVAGDIRVGIAAPYGFEASFEATSIRTTDVAPGICTRCAGDHFDATQFGLAFLVGWQYF